MKIEDWIGIGRGQGEVDLLLTGGKVVNVFSGEIHDGSVAVHAGKIVGFGDYSAKERIDVKRKYIAPGFIDGHIHIESSLLTPAEFARAAVARGTTGVVVDPHEAANVLGIRGIEMFLNGTEGLPVTFYVMLPSCVPATSMETSGAELTAESLVTYLVHPRVLGLAEMMNFPGVLTCDPGVLSKLTLIGCKIVDGHAPGLTGKDLNAYILAGIDSDHESFTLEEAREKLRAGMYVMIREGTSARNMADLIPAVTPFNSHRCLLVTDDRHADELVSLGHLDHLLRRAVSLGIDPVTAISMVTCSPAGRFGLRARGAIVPGYWADLVVLEDLESFRVTDVFKNGRPVVRAGEVVPFDPPLLPVGITDTVRANPVNRTDFELSMTQGTDIRIIGLIPGQIVTDRLIEKAPVRDGKAVADPDRDIAKLTVVERHRWTGNKGVGFVRGFGLRCGALATSVAHDSHNIVAVGVSDDDLAMAVNKVIDLSGGMVIVREGEIKASLSLPIGGLMSDLPLGEVVEKIESLRAEAAELGCPLADPFMALSFLALPVIPALKLTDRGLFDIETFSHVPLKVEG